jgi:hypothetical protein
LPLIGFEAACGGQTPCGERARIVVLNALGDTGLRYLALLLQGIPRSCKLDSQLNYVDVPLAALELAAVQVGEQVARVPDLAAWNGWCVTRICNLALGRMFGRKRLLQEPSPPRRSVFACITVNASTPGPIWSARYWPASARSG